VTTAPVAVQPIPRGTLAGRVGRRALDWVPALVVLVLVFLSRLLGLMLCLSASFRLLHSFFGLFT